MKVVGELSVPQEAPGTLGLPGTDIITKLRVGAAPVGWG